MKLKIYHYFIKLSSKRKVAEFYHRFMNLITEFDQILSSNNTLFKFSSLLKFKQIMLESD